MLVAASTPAPTPNRDLPGYSNYIISPLADLFLESYDLSPRNPLAGAIFTVTFRISNKVATKTGGCWMVEA